MKKKSLREKFLRKTKKRVKEELSSRDMLLGHCAKMLEGIDEAMHILTEKLEDAYRIYFPEFPVRDREKFVKAVLKIDNKKEIDEALLSEVVGKSLAKALVEQGKSSIGANLKQKDVIMLKEMAKRIELLRELKEQMVRYTEELANEVCPNLCCLLGPTLSAKLVAHAKSVQRLALMPASTIQVLGAEKALFKHLRTKGRVKPPKHGIIFQYAKVCGSPKKVRGKIARALATKISMAAKADAFTHHFIGERLKEEFERRYREIMSELEKRKGKK